MSLFVNNDMKLPNSCSECPLKYSSHDIYCCRMIYADGSIVCIDGYTERRNPDCPLPLVKIPTPHGRLIDADRLEDRIKNMVGKYDTAIPLNVVYRLIADAHPVIEAEE